MMTEAEKKPWLATQTAHWAIVVAIMFGGAAWFRLSGAHFVWGSPVFYFLSPFLFFGMLIAELAALGATQGWSRRTRGLALAIAVLFALFAGNQVFVMPLSTDLPMLSYLILRRRFLSPRTAPWRTPEIWAGILMLALVVYIKVTFLPQPAEMIAGVLAGLLLFVLDRWWQQSTKEDELAQPPPGN